MKRTTIAAIVLVCSLASAGCAPGRYTQYERGRFSAEDSLSVMTKQEVVALSKAGISDSVIITMIDASDSYFRLGARDVIALADSGVSESVINAMIKTDEPMQDENNLPGYAYYPPYYWYAYPSFSLGFSFRHYHLFHAYRFGYPRYNGFGGRRGFGGSHGFGSGGRGFGGGRGSGGSRSHGGHR